MDLVGKAGFQGDRGQRLAGTWHQNLGPSIRRRMK
jgi:hypothetical protein